MMSFMPTWQSYVAHTTGPMFTPEQCKLIINAGHSCKPEQAKVGGGKGGKPDTKKTQTWIDKLDVDDEFSAIVDDTIENGDKWLGKSALSPETDNVYVCEGWVYIPSSWSGTRDIGVDSATSWGELKGPSLNADYTVKDAWQYASKTFYSSASAGTAPIYLRAEAENGLVKNDFVYLDNFKLYKITNTDIGMCADTLTAPFEGDTP